MNRATLFFLLACFFIAFFLRWYLLPTHLFFGPEQGRDFLAIRNIVVNHGLTLIGPKTDFAGIFHGPLYYYIAAAPFWISGGNPLVVMGFFTALQALTVFLAYRAGKEFSGKRSIGLLTAILFTFSYGSIVYSRWLTGVPLTIPLSFAFAWFLFRFLHEKRGTLPVLAIIAALLCQVEFINFLFVPLLLTYVVIRHWDSIRKIPLSTRTFSLILFFIFAGGTYVLFDIRHNFLVIKSIFGLFAVAGHQAVPWTSSIKDVTTGFVQAMGSFLGVPFLLAIFVSVVILLFSGDVLLVWLVIPIVILSLFRRGTLEQLFVFTIPAFLIGVALVIREIAHRFGRAVAIIVLTGIVVINIWQVGRNFPTNEHVFFQSTQPAVRYSDQLTVVDRIYAKAGRQPFEIQAYTIPYFWQDAWTYLFWYRGHMPVATAGNIMFVIIQKDRSDPTFQNNWYRDTVSRWGKLIDQFTVGEYTVEERILGEPL